MNLHAGTPGTITFDNRTIATDPTEEILGKKILYRALAFKPRDVFDMAVGLDKDRDAAFAALRATRPMHTALAQRLTTLSTWSAASLARDIVPTEGGRRYLGTMLDCVRDGLNTVIREDVVRPRPSRAKGGGREI